ncbi:hypothetical protein GT347_21170 [Xylophilus rhododendri]|uniref:Uncharacterized protein n=1 Tax=Xylophilus rhododendri TaxID=2697032 RepID=A0A857JB34_9BURK|nr:hypothetical protein [Xylophilus rhododendri]QHJ00270.1 hypothetical protein GT347_21170 [Xylophilus rhododendri]
MTTIQGIPSSTSAWADKSGAKSTAGTGSSGGSEFQAVLDKAESRSKSVTGTTDSSDDTIRTLARLDNNSNLQLNQSQYDTGSASTTAAPSRLPPPPALFTRDASDNTSDTSTQAKRVDQIGIYGNGVGQSETAALQQMAQAALDAVPAMAQDYNSTASLSSGSSSSSGSSAAAPVATSQQAVSQSYDSTQMAQQILRQYQQVGSGGSTGSSTGGSVDAVA